MSEVRATKYTVYPDGYDTFVNSDKYLWTLTVEERDREKGLWSVKDHFDCYDREGNRDSEPMPSSRTKKWLKAHRFPLEEALSIAERLVDSIVWNGCTAREASARVAQRRGLQ